MNFFSQRGRNLIMSLVELAVGILLLINPEGFTNTIIRCIGIVMIVLSVERLIHYYQDIKNHMERRSDLVSGIVGTVIGAFFALFSGWLLATFSAVAFLYALFMLIGGITKVRWAFALKELHGNWLVYLISAVCTIIVAVIIILNPFSTTLLLWRFIGISLIITALLDILGIYFAVH